MEQSKSGTVRAVDRALDILLCFTDEIDLGLTEIAEKTGLHKSTVFRLLASLEGKGFVIRDSVTEKYRLGFRIWELSANLSQSDDPGTLLLPEMERLRDILGETISLYIRDGNERIRIQAVQSKHSIRRVAPIGARLPLYVGASSKILIAFADIDTQENMIQEWRELIDISAYKDQIADIQKVGYATSIEEREPGVAAVSAPIFNRSHQLVAALSVSGPVNRLTLENMKEHAGIMIETAKRMGKMIR
ncbi:IclR family transcriptional regulator [Chengkuizengella sp. SCS-71B]|uniref:IclR family transcriptional regulator n=1 Tax=Chengkuizengella sp. SCS-71B TaxID=3115290 RepID=UPI0032C247AC